MAADRTLAGQPLLTAYFMSCGSAPLALSLCTLACSAATSCSYMAISLASRLTTPALTLRAFLSASDMTVSSSRQGWTGIWN